MARTGRAIVATRVANVDVDVTVDSRGAFYVYRAQEEDEYLAFAYNMEEAVKKAGATLSRNRTKVSVPFVTLDGDEGVATGRHARSGKVLVRVGNESASQLDAYSRVLRSDTPRETVKEIVQLREIARRAQRGAEELERRYRLNLGGAVDEAITKASEGESR
jgi:hypothetical protein